MNIRQQNKLIKSLAERCEELLELCEGLIEANYPKEQASSMIGMLNAYFNDENECIPCVDYFCRIYANQQENTRNWREQQKANASKEASND